VQEQQQIPRKHTVEICEPYSCDLAVLIGIENISLAVDVIVDPVFNILEISLVSSSPPDQILAVEIK